MPSPPRDAAMQFHSLRAQPAALGLILLFLTPGALALNWIALAGIWWQNRAATYPVAMATVTGSSIVEHRGAKGKRSYSLSLAYRFTVDGVVYTGTRVRYYASNNSSRKAVEELQAQYLVGRVIEVFYPPDAPGDAIITPGVQGSDWLRLLPTVAATLVVVGIWGLVLSRRTPFDPADPTWLTRTDTGWRVRLPSTSGRGVFIIGFAIVAGIAWIGITVRVGENPDPTVVGTAFAAAFAFAAAGAALLARERVLEADLDTQELVLPAPWLGDPVRVPFTGVGMVVVRSETKSAGRNSTYEVFHCDVGWRADNRVGQTTLATFMEASQADRLALWVKLNCGLVVPEADTAREFAASGQSSPV